MRTLNVAIVLAAGGLLPACATVVRGTQQDVSIVSEPPSALAKLSNGMSCTTPCKLELDRSKDVTVRVTKPGYAPSETSITSRMRGSDYLLTVGGNLMVGGIIGAVVDGTNGAMRSLEPSPLHVKLQRRGAAPDTADGSTARMAALVDLSEPTACDGIPGVPQGVSSYVVGPGPGERGNVVICGEVAPN